MAVTLSAIALAEALAINQALADRLLPVGTALVDGYTTDCPEAISNEACIRVAGWLAEAPSSGARSESVGDIRTGWSPSMTGALRSSGAMALLSPWKIRRAGALG